MTDDETTIPNTLGGQLEGPWQALFTDAHETDADEWTMPAMLAAVTAERIGDTTVEGADHVDHEHGAYAVWAGVLDAVTDGLNHGEHPGDTLAGLCAALRASDLTRAQARHWLGLDHGIVVSAALLCEIWAIEVPEGDPAAEAEVHAWLAAHEGEDHREHPNAREVRSLVGLDIYGHLYRIRYPRGADHGTSVVVPLPGLAAPGTFADMRGIDTVVDGRTFAALGLTLATLAHLTESTDEDGWP